MPISPREFVDRWAQSSLREQQGAQSHFNELCELVGYKTPAQLDPDGEFFTFEEQVTKATGGRGRADVWYKDRFAWEYKGKHKDLDAAYAQLLAYRGGLGNPPLLVVCDFMEYRVYPQWAHTSGQPFVFHNEDLLQREAQNFILWLLESPERFKELREHERKEREELTLKLANTFAHLADLMRDHKDEDGQPVWESMQIARFLTKLVFSLFAEDIGLLPRPFNNNIFRYFVENAYNIPDQFTPTMQMLFEAMDGQTTGFLMQPVPYFNGGLFDDSSPGVGDGTEALDITLIPGAIDVLGEVSEADWRNVDPTIFGTLFEGALDPDKRAQLGAHFTGESDIRLVVEPVLMQPLYRLWEETQAEAEPLMQTYLRKETPRAEQEARESLIALHDQMMEKLENTRVLDPACGSGNFLYVSLRAMKDLEAKVRKFFEALELPFRDVVTPRQLYGIEKDEFASRLAHVVAWIGYLQWRYEDEGILHAKMPQKIAHPRQLPHPIIQDKYRPDEPDHFQCADSIMRYDEKGKLYEPEWPEVDVIMGNPPFLGSKRMRSELQDDYVDNLFALYEGRVPHEADLVTYWHEKARAQIEQGKAKCAGLLATNSIRGGANREVLKRIKQTGDIFMAWSDNPWVLEGAAVRISIIGFDDGTRQDHTLDGAPVNQINSDLQNTIDATQARQLKENADITFMGVTPGGPFDIPEGDVHHWSKDSSNPNRRPNSDVLRPYYNAIDLVRRPRDVWTIDFTGLSLKEASQYILPMAHVESHVRPMRERSRQTTQEKEHWWLYTRLRPEMRSAIEPLSRYIATPMVSKFRIFRWLKPEIVPANLINVIAREDDYFFGVLHSYLHEIWSLRLGTSLEDRPRYTPTTTFETFPFPWPPGSEDTESAVYQAISAAAKQLHEEREAWLNPPELLGENAGVGAADTLKKRTLTNLYNAVVDYRTPSSESKRVGNARKALSPVETFAPRMAELHDTLDKAVLAAYGWDDLAGRLRTPEGDEELLRRLLAVNLERA